MASIVKRKSKYSVVYDYTDENGKRRQRWETFSTNAEAKKRKKQIEYEQGISRPTAYNLVKQGVFHSVRVGGHIRISKKSFDDWLDHADE